MGRNPSSAKVNWQDVVSKAIGAPVKQIRTKHVGNLWAGYGSVTSIDADGQRLVAKQV